MNLPSLVFCFCFSYLKFLSSFFFWNKVSLYSPRWAGIQEIFACLCFPNARIKDMCNHAQLHSVYFASVDFLSVSSLSWLSNDLSWGSEVLFFLGLKKKIISHIVVQADLKLCSSGLKFTIISCLSVPSSESPGMSSHTVPSFPL